MNIPNSVLVEADFFISYLSDNSLADNSACLLEKALSGDVDLFVSTEVYDDIITAYRTNGVSLETVINLLLDIKVYHTNLYLRLLKSQSMRSSCIISSVVVENYIISILFM